jgi:hypothetical protein
MAYTLDGLRTLARQFVRNASDPTNYSDSHLDAALMLAGEDWVTRVKPRTLATLTLTANAQTMGNMPTAWRPEYHLAATLLSPDSTPVDPNIVFTDYSEIRRQMWIYGGTSSMPTGAPTMFAFPNNGSTGGVVWPIPNASYSMLLWYWTAFPTWTAGGTASVDFSTIPDEQLRIIATDGVESKLQATEPQNRVLAVEAAQRFENAIWRIKARNAGGRGGQQSFKDDVEDRDTERTILV